MTKIFHFLLSYQSCLLFQNTLGQSAIVRFTERTCGVKCPGRNAIALHSVINYPVNSTKDATERANNAFCSQFPLRSSFPCWLFIVNKKTVEGSRQLPGAKESQSRDTKMIDADSVTFNEIPSFA